MSASSGKRKLAGPDELQRHLDDLVGSGAVVLGDGKRLRMRDDGLPEVTDSPQSPVAMPDPYSKERLLNVIRYLKSSTGPKSAPWCDALASLCELRDENSEGSGQLDMRAWEICYTAGEETILDIAYMDTLQNVLRSCSRTQWSLGVNMLLEFPQRACRLLGIRSSNNYNEEAWDDGLAEQMLEKDMEAYTLIHRCFDHLKKSRRLKWPSCRSEGAQASRYLRRLQDLASMEALEAVVENKFLLILERKAKTAQRAQEARQATQAKQTPHKPAGRK